MIGWDVDDSLTPRLYRAQSGLGTTISRRSEESEAISTGRSAQLYREIIGGECDRLVAGPTYTRSWRPRLSIGEELKAGVLLPDTLSMSKVPLLPCAPTLKCSNLTRSISSIGDVISTVISAAILAQRCEGLCF